MKQKGGLFQLACFMPAETHEVSLFLSSHFMHETMLHTRNKRRKPALCSFHVRNKLTSCVKQHETRQLKQATFLLHA